MNILNYLLQTNLYLILFMGFYTLVLKNETFFRQNRIYLNTSILLSFTIPFINSNWFQELFITQKLRETIVPTQMIYETVVVAADEGTSNRSIGDIILWIYTGVTAILFLKFLFRLVLLKSTLKPKKGAAYSFFNSMVVDQELPESGIIINHEKVHMREWHSADVLLIELASIINWFNPVVYLFKKEIRHIHEFIADEEAAAGMHSKSDYALLLFSNSLGVKPDQLSNNFFNNSLLKRRIIMLNKNKSSKTRLWKYGFSAPLFAIMLIVSTAAASSEYIYLNINSRKIIDPLESLSKNTIANTTLEDHNDLKKHIATALKESASISENKTQGYLIVKLIIQNGKIMDAQISKSLKHNLDNKVIAAIKRFRGTLDLTDDDYSLAVAYYSPTSMETSEKIPSTIFNHKNFLGMILAVKDNNDKSLVGWDKTFRSREHKNDIAEDSVNINSYPEFIGGQKGWSDYVKENLIYPQEAKKNQVQGKVIVSFTVMKDGNLADIKVLRGIGSGTEEEAIRILKASPKWKPGIEKGQPVNITYTLPILFQLTPKALEENTN